MPYKDKQKILDYQKSYYARNKESRKITDATLAELKHIVDWLEQFRR